MSYSFPPDLQSSIAQKMSLGVYASEEDLLRDALRALDHEDEDVAAVQSAIDEWRAGDEGETVEEAFDWVRRNVDGPPAE